jgi:hypothetical protein
MRSTMIDLVGVALVALVAGWVAAMTVLVSAPDPAPVRLDYSTVIQEDDPRWDCRTMGNRICGPGKG